MGALDYYRYQATARGVHSAADVGHCSRDKAYLYDQVVRPWLSPDPAEPIVELACGHGAFLHWLRDRGYTRAVGVDSSPEQISWAQQVGVTVHQAEVNPWLAAQPEASLRTLVGIDFIEHISKDDLMELLRQSSRVLLRGGRLILRYPNGDSPLVGRNLFNDITHVWTYTPNCLDTLARMHGFTRTSFVDESAVAIRDHRWLKVPLCKLSQWLLGALWRAATRERLQHWSPNLWACLEK